ncbi:hypothetical protein TcasGA2_TC008434 [Tribolium castaneum]|uniref:Uncharacterized protein n=1 Tax=Tribolium castaneum TaxID=7070 RepID=D2A1Z7_TRICA|nr:hypothetical protein TcasGA2_TC008434 [Tribolium castaneum]
MGVVAQLWLARGGKLTSVAACGRCTAGIGLVLAHPIDRQIVIVVNRQLYGTVDVCISVGGATNQWSTNCLFSTKTTQEKNYRQTVKILRLDAGFSQIDNRRSGCARLFRQKQTQEVWWSATDKVACSKKEATSCGRDARPGNTARVRVPD